jgi:uncharacterized membrane protein YqjE
MSESGSVPFTAALKNLAGTLIGVVHTRIELLSTEWEEERARLGRIWIALSLTLFFTGVATVLAAAFVVVSLWESYRLWALGAMTLVFVAAAVVCWRIAMHALAAKPRLFASTLAAFEADRAALVSGRTGEQ